MWLDLLIVWEIVGNGVLWWRYLCIVVFCNVLNYNILLATTSWFFLGYCSGIYFWEREREWRRSLIRSKVIISKRGWFRWNYGNIYEKTVKRLDTLLASSMDFFSTSQEVRDVLFSPYTTIRLWTTEHNDVTISRFGFIICFTCNCSVIWN